MADVICAYAGMTMPRIDLFVAYEEKDKAKALGAKWDITNKLWFVPEGVDPAPFEQWINKAPKMTPNIRCNRFYVATAMETCCTCTAPVKMTTFVLPRGWEELRDNDETGEKYWDRIELDFILSYVRYINDAAKNAVAKISPQYKFGISSVYKRTNYLNYCEKCGSIQIEPNSGNTHVFKPEIIEQAEKITLHYFNEPFEAYAGHLGTLRCHGGANAFDYMRLHGIDD